MGVAQAPFNAPPQKKEQDQGLMEKQSPETCQGTAEQALNCVHSYLLALFANTSSLL